MSIMTVDSVKKRALFKQRRKGSNFRLWRGEESTDNSSQNPARRPRKCGPLKHVKKPRRSKRQKQADRYATYRELLHDTYAMMRR